MSNKLANTVTLYTIDDLMGVLPAGLNFTKKAVTEKLEESCHYRAIGGKMFLTHEDVKNFLGWLRAAPTAREASARLGAGRLLSGGRPAPSEQGYLVIIGEQLTVGGFLFIGWAPADERGPSDLLTLVQFGYPAPLVAKGIRPATPAQVAKIKKELEEWRVRTDDENWFEHDKNSHAYVHALIHGKQSIEEQLRDDDDNGEQKAQ